MKRANGFTLIELLVVLTIMGLAMAAVTLSLRDSSQDQLARDAQRLIAQLEKARALARTTQETWQWQTVAGGYVLQSANDPRPPAVQPWTLPQTTASASRQPLLLGPEPVIGPAWIELSLPNHSALHIRITTDGVGHFEVRP